MGNKVIYGLKNVYYATTGVSNGTITYGTPIAIPGAVNMSLSSNMEITNIAADDNSKYVSATENGGYSGTLEVLNVPESFYADVLGMTYNSTSGTVLENKENAPKPFALLFEFSGDAKKTRHVFYNCLATNPDVASATKDGAISPSTITVNLEVSPAADTGDIKYSITEASNSTYTDWFSAVQVAGV